MIRFFQNLFSRPTPSVVTPSLSSSRRISPLDLGQALIQEGKLKEAKEILEKDISDSKIPHQFFLLGYACQQLNQLQLAAQYIERACTLEPTNSLYIYQSAVISQNLGLRTQAILSYRQSLSINPKQKNAVIYCVKLLEEENRLNEALQLLKDFEIVEPNDEEVQKNIRRLSFMQGDDAFVPSGYLSCSISSVLEYSVKNNWVIHKYSDAEEMKTRSPIVYGVSDPFDAGPTFSNPLYCAELRDVQAWAGRTILLHRGVILNDFLTHPRCEAVDVLDGQFVIAQRKDRLWVKQDSPDSVEEKGIMLFGDGSTQYGVWVYEFLPKVPSILANTMYQNWPIFVDEGLPPNIIESLELLVGKEREVKVFPKGKSLLFKKLLFLSNFTHTPMYLKVGIPQTVHDGSTSDKTLKVLSDALAKRPTKENKREKLYLSRKKSTWRKLLNESEVELYLSKVGFRSVAIEDLTFSQMLDLMSTAKSVVGPVGSALNNIVFAPRDCKMLILSPPQLGNHVSWASALNNMGYRAIFQCGRAAENKVNTDKFANYEIDLKLLAEVLSIEGL